MNRNDSFDFDRIIDRRGTGSLKWDVAQDELPMWVADMDFQAAPAIRKAIEKRLAHGVFGYSILPDTWYTAYQDWWRRRHGLSIGKEDLIFCTGVVPAISTCVRKLTTPAEKVLIQSPVYNIFYNSIYNNGRYIIDSPLVRDGDGFTIDWDDLEDKLADPQTSLMILCNPHNPVGRIWSREELARIGELCLRHHVTVVSDEIHCDIVKPGRGYVPFASASETCRMISVTCIAPTKAFNIAGLQTAAVAVFDSALRHKVWRALNTDEVAEPNAFAVDAAIAAFQESGGWLDALNEYIDANKQFAETYIKENIPAVTVTRSEATYLLWLDCSSVTEDSRVLAGKIRARTGLFLSDGAQYGGSGITYLRLNCACPRALLEDGMERLARALRD